MKRLRAWTLRLAGILPNDRRDRSLADEIESHLQMHIDDNLRSGMTHDQARRDAILKLGGVEPTKEAYRDRSSIPFLENLLQDDSRPPRRVRTGPLFSNLCLEIAAPYALAVVCCGVPLPDRTDGAATLHFSRLAC